MKKIVLAVLVNYGDEQLDYLQEVVTALKKFEKYRVTVVVHSNITLDQIKGIDQVKLFEKQPGVKSLTDVLFKLKLGVKWTGRMFDLNLLPMTCRKTIVEAANQYDYYIFSENDHLWLEHHLDNFLEYEAILPINRIAGLIQYEANESGKYFPGHHAHYDWDLDSIEVHGGKIFAHFTNVHQASFLISNTQLSRILETKDFGNFLSKDSYSTKCRTNTDLYQYCGMKKLICVSDFEENLIHHLPNIYINGDKGREKLRSEEKRMQEGVNKVLSKTPN